jgi:hypothetical protein
MDVIRSLSSLSSEGVCKERVIDGVQLFSLTFLPPAFFVFLLRKIFHRLLRFRLVKILLSFFVITTATLAGCDTNTTLTSKMVTSPESGVHKPQNVMIRALLTFVTNLSCD